MTVFFKSMANFFIEVKLKYTSKTDKLEHFNRTSPMLKNSHKQMFYFLHRIEQTLSKQKNLYHIYLAMVCWFIAMKSDVVYDAAHSEYAE